MSKTNNDPRQKLYGDEHHGMSHNEKVYESSATGAHPAKSDDEWERDHEDGVNEGAPDDDDDDL